MTVFCTDRLALPKSTTQTLTPGILEAARGDYKILTSDLPQSRSCPSSASCFPVEEVHYAGLDMGDMCWFVARAVDAKPPHLVRLLWVEAIAAERVRQRVPELFRQLGLRALCVDAGPLRDLARDLTFSLNKMNGSEQESAPPERCFWHEASQKWRNAKCAAVEFTQREGQGLRHKLAQTVEGHTYPLLAANRDETIERVVQELLPPGVGDPRLIENRDGTAAAIPTQRFFLPAKTDDSREVLDIYDRHLLAGARQERSADGKTLRYLDKCENHFLLATAYAALAELLSPINGEDQIALPAFRPLPSLRGANRRERSVLG